MSDPQDGTTAEDGPGPGTGAEGIDFAVLAYREEGAWQVGEVPAHALADLDAVATELRRWPGDHGTLGLVSVDEDFFVLVRVSGAHTRVLLSDITAATDWPLARQAVEFLELPVPEDEDDSAPAGDLGIVDDLGMAAMDMGVLIDDYDLYPDEMLSTVAEKLGFGPAFDDAVGLSLA